VVVGQIRHGQGMFWLHNETLKGIELLVKVMRYDQFVKRPLDDDFPDRGCADQHLVRAIGNSILRPLGERSIVVEPPQEHMGIQ